MYTFDNGNSWDLVASRYDGSDLGVGVDRALYRDLILKIWLTVFDLSVLRALHSDPQKVMYKLAKLCGTYFMC